MLWNLILNFWATPENIIGLILNLATIVSICLIFHVWQEKWWKSLIPVYGTYVMYKHTWKKGKCVFILPLLCDVIGARCMSFVKKGIASDVFESIELYMETEQIDVNIDITQMLLCVGLFLICTLISFLFTRITYVKVCDNLQIKSMVLKVGTFVLPEVFLLVVYIGFRKKFIRSH